MGEGTSRAVFSTLIAWHLTHAAGSVAEKRAELERLQSILSRLESLDPQPSAPRIQGEDYMYDMLLELQRRRRAALEYEISRLQKCLKRVRRKKKSDEKKPEL